MVTFVNASSNCSDTVVTLGCNGDVPLFMISPDAPQVAYSRIHAWTVAAAEPYCVVMAPGCAPTPDVLASMIARMEEIPELAAITIGNEAEVKAVLAPDMRLTVIRRSALYAAHGFDVGYGGLGEALDLGWRWWLMGYQVETANSALPLPASPSAYPVALAWRNLLWTLAKNCETQMMGVEVANTMLACMATVYAEVEPMALPVQLSPVPWHRRLWLNLSRRFWNKSNQLHVYRDDLTVPRVQIPSRLAVTAVTLNDIVAVMPILLESHRWIQAQRTRSDAEISQMLDITLVAWIKQRFLELGNAADR